MTSIVTRPGIAGRSPTHGSTGWSSTLIAVNDSGQLHIFDTGGPGYRALWPSWLKEIDKTVDDVETVFLTHAHWDHIGAFASFPNARYVIGRHELDWANGPGRSNPYIEPSLVDGLIGTARVDVVDDEQTIAGVTVVATPGHTPGHISYLIDDGKQARVFCGDAIKDPDELAGGDFAITEDTAQSSQSRSKLTQLMAQGATLLLGHGDWTDQHPSGSRAI